MVKDLKYDPWSLHTRTYKMKCLLKNTFPLYIFTWRHNQDNQKFFKQLVMLQIYTYFVGISSLHQKPIIIQREHFEENMNTNASLSKMNRVLIKLYNLFMELIFQFRHKSVSFTRHKSELRKSHVKFSSFLLSLPLYSLPPAQTYKMQRGFVCRSLKADGPSLVLFHGIRSLLQHP